MIVVAIIGLLAAVAIPKFAEMVRKAKEGNTKGNLGAVRGALSIYYSSMEGWYPVGPAGNPSPLLTNTLTPKYMSVLPKIELANYHFVTNLVSNVTAATVNDSGEWMYDGAGPADLQWGQIWIDCTHTDTKGDLWSAF
jgi:type II secretory pathway pseudopilin PulG